MKIKNHDYSMYLGIGKNPKCQIVRHLSGIWDFKSNKKQQFIKHQRGEVEISLLFNIENLLKKKVAKLSDPSNHCIIDCSKIDDTTNQNVRLIIRLLNSFTLKHDLNLFLQFPKYSNLEDSYLYLESTMELNPSNTRQKLVNDVHIEVGGELGEVGNMNLDEIQKRVTLSMSAGKYFLASSDKKTTESYLSIVWI